MPKKDLSRFFDTSTFLFKRNPDTSVNNKHRTVSAPYNVWETDDKMTVSTSVSRTE